MPNLNSNRKVYARRRHVVSQETKRQQEQRAAAPKARARAWSPETGFMNCNKPLSDNRKGEKP